MTTMTTEHRPLPRARPSAMRDLRGYLIAVLAMAYLIAWWAFGTGAPRSATPIGVPPEPGPGTVPELASGTAAAHSPTVATWYSDLPASRRPAIHLPLGWHMAAATAPGEATRLSTPVPVRVAPARRGRIRTRSS